MATRFYIPRWDGRAAAVSPAFGSAWERTTNAFRALAATTKGATTPLSTTGSQFSKDGAAAGYDVLQMQLVSDPLAAQTISGTFSAVVRGGESVSTADASLQVVLRVVSGDGATERGVLYAGHSAALNATAGAIGQEFGTTSMTRIFPAGTALSSVAALDGDRLVIEVGQRFHGTNTGVNGFLTFGDNSATADHTLAAGTSTALCPWVELSADLTWQSAGSTVSGAGASDFGFTAVSAGARAVSGGAASAAVFSATAVGVRAVAGGAAAGFGFAAGASGVRRVSGAVGLAVAFGAAASGSREVRAGAALAVGFAAAASGVVVTPGGVVVRPDSGVTPRPSAGVTARASSGVTVRPSAGVTVRPLAGVTERP